MLFCKRVGLGVLLFSLLYFLHDEMSGRGEVYLNSGISFGWEVPIYLPFFFFFVFLCFFFAWGYRGSFWLGFLGLLVGAGINLLDRVRFVAVRDYFNFFSLFYNNLADWLIFLSVIMILIVAKKNGEKTRNQEGF